MLGSIQALKTKATRGLRRALTPIGSDKLRAALEQLIVHKPEILFVHSSLSSCGKFTGGPEEVLHVFREFGTTLLLPTFTYCYPEILGDTGPLFDARTTPSQTGLLTEVYRKQGGVVRSIHATHSVAAAGPLATELCANHYQQNTPCGAGTPYARLLERKASVLLFGVSFHSYTLYHTAEDASGSAFAYEPETLDQLRVIDESGQPHDCWSRRQSRVPRRFAEAGDLLERVGLARRVQLGRGALLYVPDCVKVHDFLVERLRQTPDFLYHSCTRSLA